MPCKSSTAQGLFFVVKCILLAVFVYFLFFVFDQSGGSRGQVVDPRGEQFRWLSSQLLCPPLLDNSSQSVCTVQADVSDCVFDATAHEPQGTFNWLSPTLTAFRINSS